MKKVRWGVLSTARIGTRKVIPAMKAGTLCEVTAISSRDINKAREVAKKLDIPKAYGSYEELLADSEIDAVYIPLPNDLHIAWSLKALNANKHILCEKPIGLSVSEVLELAEAAKEKPKLKVMEAFMYRHHPQWQKAKHLIREEKIGKLRTIQSFFSYFNANPDDNRNIQEKGGGGMMDIGCYCISLSRFIFGKEPQRVCSSIEYDPKFNTDRLTCAIMEFGNGTSTFTCSTQLNIFQRVMIFGTKGRIEIQLPFTPSPYIQSRLWYQPGQLGGKEILFDPCDQYTIQGDRFSKAILDDSEVPTPIEDAISNLQVLEALYLSGQTQRWVEIAAPSSSDINLTGPK